jgi:N-acetylglutamate synthase-like GNAT family acetyltransferase
MDGYTVTKLAQAPEMRCELAEWFNKRWGIPLEAYLKSMRECIDSGSAVPQWYAVTDKGKIIAGLGVIENDFHDRKDLAPNVCAVYVDKDYRRKGIARKMLGYVCDDMKSRGIETLYLITNHTSFYERCGWEFLCMVQGDGETHKSRMYVHRA